MKAHKQVRVVKGEGRSLGVAVTVRNVGEELD